MRQDIRSIPVAAFVAALLACVACASASPRPARPAANTTVRPASASSGVGHVVVVVMENHSYSDIIGNPQAPYLNALAKRGSSLTAMHAITHPSQPNYLALYSGGTQGITDDSCPHTFAGPDLGAELLGAGLGFAGYSEDLPKPGSTVCTAGEYARKHVPWTDFSDDPAAVNRPFTAFPSSPASLPSVSFVIPNLLHDMHDGTIAQADSWLRTNLGSYARWAPQHNSLLVITWDEDDYSAANRIPTIVVGAGVSAGPDNGSYTTYGLLRGIEDRLGLARLGASATARPVPLG